MREYSDIYHEVSAKYACEHAKQERRNKPDKNGHPMIVMQCLDCGERLGGYIRARTLSRDEIAALPLFDKGLQRERDSRRFNEIHALWDAEKKDAEAAWRARYEAHLRSPKWKALSRKVILRAQGICEACRERPATQAHHLTYERMGDEMLFDLVGVCDACHKKIHPQIEAEDDSCPF